MDPSLKEKLISKEDEASNFDQPDTTIESTSPAIDNFEYEEFTGGRNGRTCPTCHGSGRISKDHESDAVALIPYTDDRLNPSKTKQYVVLAVVVCLILSGLSLFFVLPRSTSLSDTHITNTSIFIPENENTAYINVTHKFKVTNNNYFSVKLKNISVEATFDYKKILVGKGYLKTEVNISPLSSQIVSVMVPTVMSMENNLGFVAFYCKEFGYRFALLLDVLMESTYLNHKEENSLESYVSIDCGTRYFVKIKNQNATNLVE